MKQKIRAYNCHDDAMEYLEEQVDKIIDEEKKEGYILQQIHSAGENRYILILLFVNNEDEAL